ncbi:hypothetical protein ABVT39_021683 [Epinephelus coioides]
MGIYHHPRGVCECVCLFKSQYQERTGPTPELSLGDTDAPVLIVGGAPEKAPKSASEGGGGGGGGRGGGGDQERQRESEPAAAAAVLVAVEVVVAAVCRPLAPRPPCDHPGEACSLPARLPPSIISLWSSRFQFVSWNYTRRKEQVEKEG